MELSYNRIDLAASETRHFQVHPDKPFMPFDIIRRSTGEEWLVPFSPISFTDPVDWRLYRREDHVMIPLVPYLLPTAPDLALGFMIQLAAGCFASLARPVKKIHVATGYPVHDLFDELNSERTWQYYVGFAVVLER